MFAMKRRDLKYENRSTYEVGCDAKKRAEISVKNSRRQLYALTPKVNKKLLLKLRNTAIKMHSLVLWLKADPRTSSVLSEKQIRTKQSTTFGKWGDQWHEIQKIASSGNYNAFLSNRFYQIIFINQICIFIKRVESEKRTRNYRG